MECREVTFRYPVLTRLDAPKSNLSTRVSVEGLVEGDDWCV